MSGQMIRLIVSIAASVPLAIAVAAVGECPAFHRRKRVAKMDVNACSRRAADHF